MDKRQMKTLQIMESLLDGIDTSVFPLNTVDREVYARICDKNGFHIADVHTPRFAKLFVELANTLMAYKMAVAERQQQRTLSTHKCEVVPVVLEKHPNADTLSVVQVFGYPVVVRTADWEGKTKGVYLPPDSVVDVTRPEFAFLASGTKTQHRVKAIKLRGVYSFGLLMPVADDAEIGDDWAELYGVEHYEPAMKRTCTGGNAEVAPAVLEGLSKYDIDSLRRYNHVFEPGETVFVTEKIHGANSRYCFMDGRMWCGSRNQWKAPSDSCIWWKALANHPEIEAFCRSNEGCVLYGEVYGDVQELSYGVNGDVRFMAFDVLDRTGKFWGPDLLREQAEQFNVPLVPLLAVMPYDFDTICRMAEGASTVHGANHVREGCVVRPYFERFHQAVGRVVLKVVGAGYLSQV